MVDNEDVQEDAQELFRVDGWNPDNAFPPSRKFKEKLEMPEDTKTFKPSLEEAPKLEMKPLPSHIKYAYLGENETLPVIISSTLTPDQEEKLLEVLKTFKEAIGWTMADIKGISPSICVHKILLQDDAKPTIEG